MTAVNVPVPDPDGVCVTPVPPIVGFEFVLVRLQTIPLDVTEHIPINVTLPPDVAEVVEVTTGVVVVTVGADDIVREPTVEYDVPMPFVA
jgi:hypothetical protein